MCAESHNTYRKKKKKSIWNCTALNHPDRWGEKNSKSIFDSLIWFGGGRDACPAAPLLLRWVELGTTVLLLQEREKKQTCEGAKQSPVRYTESPPSCYIHAIFILHLHSLLFAVEGNSVAQTAKNRRCYSRLSQFCHFWWWSSYVFVQMVHANIQNGAYVFVKKKKKT